MRNQRDDFIVRPPRRPRIAWRVVVVFLSALALSWGLLRVVDVLDLAPEYVRAFEGFVFGVLVGREAGKVLNAWVSKVWHEYDRIFGRWLIGELNREHDRRARQAQLN